MGLTDVTEEDILQIVENDFDGHAHARKGAQTKIIIPQMKQVSVAAFYMPNATVNEIGDNEIGITSYEKLMWYRNHILEECGPNFLPLFSLYLSEKLSVADIERAWKEKLISGIKYYPKGATTGSEGGSSGFAKLRAQLECMNDLKITFNMHGEIPTIDGINPVPGGEREPLFYRTEGEELLQWYTGPIVAEHITTWEGVEFTKRYDNVVATLTPQHCLLSNMAIFHKVKANNDWYNYAIKMGLCPSMICAPVLKEQTQVAAIWQALIWQYRQKKKKFFKGTDTAHHPPHGKYKEECDCGVYNSPIQMEMYYMLFKYLDTYSCKGIMDDFQRFMSDIGMEFYGITGKVTNKTIAIVRTPNKIEAEYGGAVPPFAGETLPWKAIDITAALADE